MGNEDTVMTGEEGMLRHFTNLFITHAREHHFTVLTKAADRHGSYVWEAGRHEGLNRFVLLGLTLIPASQLEEWVEMPGNHVAAGMLMPDALPFAGELSIGADDGHRFTRRLTHTFIYVTVPGKGVVTDTSIDQALATAFREVMEIQPGQLTEQYLVPR